MKGFEFRTVSSVISEPGSSTQLGPLVADLGASRALIVTDPAILALGLTDGARESLDKAGIATAVFDEVEADPAEATILAATGVAREAEANAIIGFGGGSSMDVAKLVALLARTHQPLDEAYGVDKARGERLALVQVPTTAGTGSEVSPVAVVTTGATTKMGVVSPILYADLAVLDADLTLGLPQDVTAATGIDAMVHALEAYTSRIKKNPISDALARESLSLLGRNIRAVCADATDRAARANMLLGSMLAGMAFSNAPTAAVHALAYPIGGHFHVAHGLSNALVLTHVMRFNTPAAKREYAEIAPLAFPSIQADEDTVAAERLADSFAALIDDLGIETRLRDVGISHNQLPMLAEEAMKQQRLLVNNPRDVTYDDALAIYRQAF